MKAQRRRMLPVSVALLAGVLAAGAAAGAAERNPLKVVTTLPVLAELVTEVGGDAVEVRALANPQQDPHFVQPRPTLMKAVRDADVFVEIGLQLEPWAQKVVDGAGNPRVQTGLPGRIVASSGIRTLDRPATLTRADGDVHPQGNPHVWLDPIDAKRMAQTIARGLAAVDPQRRDAFEAGAAAFAARVDVALFGEKLVDEVGGEKLTRLAETGSLDAYLAEHALDGLLGGWLGRLRPIRGEKIVSYHTTWRYFCERFGISVPIQIEEKAGIEPSARHRDAVVRLMNEERIKAVVAAPFYDRRAGDYIAAATGARVLILPVEPAADIGDGSYLALIDHIVAALATALTG